MQAAEFGPRNRKHFHGRIELHGAGTQRNHGGGERQVARFQAAQVTEHIGLTVVTIKNRMRQKGAGAGKGHRVSDFNLRSQFRNSERRRIASVKNMEQVNEVLFHRGFVE